MDRVTLINRALARIGCLPIQSIGDPGPAGTGVLDTYEAVLEDLLSKYPWHFAKKFVALSRQTETPPLGWSSSFLLPPDRLALPRAYFDDASSDRPLTRFEVAGNRVYTATSTLFAEYQFRPEPNDMPAYFRELDTLALAAEYALEIREDTQLRQVLRRDAYGPPEMQGEGGQFKVAADLDAQANPSRQVAGGANPLTDNRSGYDDPDDARWGW